MVLATPLTCNRIGVNTPQAMSFKASSFSGTVSAFQRISARGTQEARSAALTVEGAFVCGTCGHWVLQRCCQLEASGMVVEGMQ